MNNPSFSKALTHIDDSALNFVIEMLNGDPTYAINFDRIQWDNSNNCYVIIEYLLCDETQFSKGVTPYTSHPNRYFQKNSMKFISLWQITRDLGAKLFLVNYSKKGTQYDDQVLLMEVKDIDSNKNPVVTTNDRRMTRSEFSNWLREINSRGVRK